MTFVILAFDELTPVLLLTLVFVCLMFEMKKFHNFEYNKNKKAMRFFFIMEASIMAIIWISNTAFTRNFRWKAYLLSLGLYPFE
jgi:hypothetical protein